MKRLLLATLCLPALLGASAGTIRMTTQTEPGTSVRILLNASSATTPITIDWGNGVEVKYTVDPSMAAYNRWIDGTIEGPNMKISGNVTEADLNELGITSVEVDGMAHLRSLDLAKNAITSFQLLSVTPLEDLNLSYNNIINNTYENRTLSLEYAGETLTNLSLGHNTDILCLDIRDLTVLEYLSANDCPILGSIFICMPEESRPALRSIDLSNCDLAHFYPVSLPSLNVLNLSNNALMTSADDEPFVLGNYPELHSLDVSENPGINQLDITGCTKLTNLNISNDRFERIDVSQAHDLEVLYAANNNIASFDLGNNPSLRTLNISGNPVKELDVTQFSGMRFLNISDTQISRVMLMEASYLEEFRAANTLLEFVDFNGQQPKRMRMIDLRNNPRMTGETVDYTIHTLPEAKNSGGNPDLLLSGSNAETADIAYATSVDMHWTCDITGDGTASHSNVDVNLVDATDTGENKTGTVERLYPIFGLSLDYDFDIYQTDGGKFLISQWQPVYFQKMLSVTDKALTGVPIHIYPYPEEGKRFKSVTVNGKEITSQWFVIDGPADIKVNFVNAESSITFTTTPGNPVSMLLNTTENNGTVWVDWGTGTRNEYTGMNKFQSGYSELGGTRIDGTAAGNGIITVYGNVAGIDLSGYGEYGQMMGLWDNLVSSIDLSNASDLRHLNLYWNPVTSIDLSGASNLEFLNVGYTALSSLDLSKTTQLMWLDAHSDGYGDDPGIKMLSQIDVTSLPVLQYLDIRGNEISSINLSANPYLRWFNANGNELTTVDLSANPLLEELDLNSNNLTAIDLSKQTALTNLSLSDNSISTLDLSANTSLSELSIANNDIHFIDLSNLSGLRRVYINGNGLNADELNDIYYLLPQREPGEDDENPNQVQWNLAVIQSGDKSENEATRADSSIAIDRGWTPSHLGSNGGSQMAYLDILPSVHGTVKVTGEDGTEYTTGSKVLKYSTLTITATPDEGYVMTSFSLNDEEPVVATTFEMPGIYTKLRVNFAKDSGVDGVADDSDSISTVETTTEGVVVTSAAATVDIFGTDGRSAVNAASVEGSRLFPLAAGIYVVHVADASGSHAVKTIVK